MFDGLRAQSFADALMTAPRRLAALQPTLQRLAQRRSFRLAFAVCCLAAHLFAAIKSGERFGVPFNSAPGVAPAFAQPAAASAARWNRLAVSRWDSGQYVGLALRGYSTCPEKLNLKNLRPILSSCNLAFYPGYALLGRLLSIGGRVPVDYALLAISWAASLTFLFIWTGRALVSRLGLWETYLSLILFNVFTTGFSLVTIQTEPLTLATTLGSFVALFHRRYLLAATLAGAATGLRITGLATGGACALALLLLTVIERPTHKLEWAKRGLALVVCFWGQLAMSVYHWIRFGDPLLYIHAHGQGFKHEPALTNLLSPKPAWIIRSLEQPLHEGLWLAAALLWFLLGHRGALRRSPIPEQAFWYGLFFATIAITGVGLLPLSFAGMNRYLLLALPLFFAIANMTSRRPAVFVLWAAICLFHYWQVDLCTFTGGPGNRTLQVCNTPHWMGRI